MKGLSFPLFKWGRWGFKPQLSPLCKRGIKGDLKPKLFPLCKWGLRGIKPKLSPFVKGGLRGI